MISLIWAVITFLAALWIYNDAQKCGYSKNKAMLWAIGTVISLFIVAVLYFAIGRRPQKSSLPKRADPADTVTMQDGQEPIDVNEKSACPMCGRMVPVTFTQCPHCGYTLRLSCEHCGRSLERDWKKCPYCGADAPVK